MGTAKIISFPGSRKKSRTTSKRIKNIDGIKYLSEIQIKALRRAARNQAMLDEAKKKVTGVREWMAIDILTSSGLRVAETANVRCGDIKSGYGQSELFVREGKGARSRTVEIPDSLKKHLKAFLKWKAARAEPAGPDEYVFLGQRGPWTSQAIQQIVKKYLKDLGLYETGMSAHSLRHSYAVHYYSRSGHDLRGLQKQLGHASIQTTQIYADITKEEIQRNVKGLWN